MATTDSSTPTVPNLYTRAKTFVAANKMIVIAVVIVLVVCVIMYMNSDIELFGGGNEMTKLCDSFLYGAWKGDEEICRRADTKSMQLFINKPLSSSSKKSKHKKGLITRECYLIIMDNICNQSFEISYKRGACKQVKPKDPLSKEAKVLDYKICTKCKFANEQIWPEDVCFQYNPVSGALRVYSGKQLYGLFYKDNEITNLASV